MKGAHYLKTAAWLSVARKDRSPRLKTSRVGHWLFIDLVQRKTNQRRPLAAFSLN